MNIPNALTLIRFLLIGLFVYLFFNDSLEYNTLWSFLVFIIAGATDILDGFIARRYNLITKWGKLMDPLADKSMLLTVLICLYIEGTVPLWIILIIGLKELLMIGGAAFLYRNRNVVVQANFYGKLATVLFYFAITALTFDIPYAGFVLFIAVLSTILAFLQYARINFKRKRIDKT